MARRRYSPQLKAQVVLEASEPSLTSLPASPTSSNTTAGLVYGGQVNMLSCR